MKTKKIIAAILSAGMIFSCFTANAADFGRSKALLEHFADGEVSIMYNTGYLDTGDVKPVNKDGRVMLPFRAALEGMGADVNFDDATKLVTAEKDNIKISFTLLDDTIYVDNNGEKTEVKMDVPMYVDNGNTMVPIRFMSSAFGMQVGWEGYNNTVLIFDGDGFVEEFKNAMPNLMRLSEINTNDYNKSNCNMTFDMDFGSDFSIKLDMSANASMSEGKSALTADIKSLSVKAGEDNAVIENASADIIISDGMVYLKTDIIDKLAKSTKNVELAAAALMAKPDSWISIDLMKFIDASLLTDELKELYKQIIANPTEFDANALFDEFSLGEEDELSSSDSLSFLAGLLDAYEAVDTFIKIDEKADGSINVSIKMDVDDVIGIIQNMLPDDEITDEDIKEIKDMLSFEVSANTAITDEKLTSDAHILMAVNAGTEAVHLKMDVNETNEKAEEVKIEIPEECTDITQAIIGRKFDEKTEDAKIASPE